MRKGASRDASPLLELRHFTNRLCEREAFRRQAEAAVGHTLPVLMFYGVGGTGKSWLLRRLQEEAITGGLPTARLDFDLDRGGARFHSDPAEALAEIRRQLDLPCVRFDLAYAMMRHKQGAADEPRSRKESEQAIWDLVGEIANVAVQSIPGGNVLVWVGKQLAPRAADRLRGTALGQWLESRTGDEDVRRLQALTAQDIQPELPERLAEDLEEVLPRREGNTCRAVVFLDTLEALEVAGQGADWHYYHRYRWIGRLYECLESVFLVAAGRNRLRWEEQDADWDREEYLEQHLVGGLSEKDAREYLSRCGIADGALQEAVLRVSVDTVSRVLDPAERGYHAFSLGLCATTVLAERRRGVEPDPASFAMPAGDVDELALRFLRSLSEEQARWMLRLAATPRFDHAAAEHAYRCAVGGGEHVAWKLLLDFSFMTEADMPGWWTLHPQMRRALRRRIGRDPQAERASHHEWCEYWMSRRSDDLDDASSLAWCHLYRLEPATAREAWVTAARELRARCAMARHARLIDWWTPLEIENPPYADPGGLALLADELRHVSLGNRADHLRRSIACCEAALERLTETEFPQQWAVVQNLLANAYFKLPTGDAAENLRRAIAGYEAALRVVTEAGSPERWAALQNNLGSAYSELPPEEQGDPLARALECFAAALRVRTPAAAPREWGETMHNLGLVLLCLPNGERAQSLRQAVAVFEAALKVRTPKASPREWAATQHCLGTAYAVLPTGDRKENLRQAVACFEAALHVRTEAAFPAQWAQSSLQLGAAQEALGDPASARLAYADAARGFRGLGREAEAVAAEERMRGLIQPGPTGGG